MDISKGDRIKITCNYSQIHQHTDKFQDKSHFFSLGNLLLCMHIHNHSYFAARVTDLTDPMTKMYRENMHFEPFLGAHMAKSSEGSLSCPYYN